MKDSEAYRQIGEFFERAGLRLPSYPQKLCAPFLFLVLHQREGGTET